MRILGIDPGTGRLGWAIIDKTGSRYDLVDCGCVETKAGTPLSQRLLLIEETINALVLTYKPVVAAIEDLFFTKNAKTAISVAEARGVTLLVCARHQIPVSDYTPSQIKSALTGNGKADKKQVMFMVSKFLKVPDHIKLDDVFDALAVAITYLPARMKL